MGNKSKKVNPRLLAGVNSFTAPNSNNRAARTKQATDEYLTALDRGCTVENAIKYALGKAAGNNMFKYHTALKAANVAHTFDERIPNVRGLLMKQQLAPSS